MGGGREKNGGWTLEKTNAENIHQRHGESQPLQGQMISSDGIEIARGRRDSNCNFAYRRVIKPWQKSMVSNSDIQNKVGADNRAIRQAIRK